MLWVGGEIEKLNYMISKLIEAKYGDRILKILKVSKRFSSKNIKIQRCPSQELFITAIKNKINSLTA